MPLVYFSGGIDYLIAWFLCIYFLGNSFFFEVSLVPSIISEDFY